ncbi:MAG: hypothetical protein IIW00_06755, partial [Alistipes sp.]|nr:hypothetical protein [Alistipes sp.]
MATRQEASLIHHIEAIKHLHIWGDTLSARQYAEAALQNDSTYAPAHHMMAGIAAKGEQALEHAERAYLADSTNRFYASTYVEQLLNSQKYGRATTVLERLVRRSTDPNHYRILAMLYASADRHTEAIAILDTAEVRFGRIAPLCRYRQHLLLITRQT